jgi:predicted transcriptional regulator
MELVWTLKYPVSVKEIYQILVKQGGDYSYTTIMTVMSRLAEKGVLRIKEVQKRANIYEATSAREEFIAKSTSIVLDSLIKDFPDVVFNHFLEAAQAKRITAENLDTLKERIEQKRQTENKESS